MKNKELADLLYEIGDFLEIQEEQYKPRAYRTAARNVESLSEDIEAVHEQGELEQITGVGESIAEKIAEYLETGELAYYEELKSDLPVDIDAITSVEGIGPKTAKKLYLELGVTTLEDLERAAEAGEIAGLEGFGEKSQQNILDNLELAKRGQERMLLGRAFPIAEDIESRLQDSKEFNRVSIVGSFRRRRPTVGDIDILATADDPKAAIDTFCTHDDVKDVLARGETKSSVIVSGDLQLDLRIVGPEEFGAALIYFTGSKAHNIALRNRAIESEWKLNEYGLFDVSDIDASQTGQRVGERIAGDTEKEVYGALDLAWIPPELREDTGEIPAAADQELPDLVELTDIRGDLQVHTEYSDGSNSVYEMAEAADELGREYILISDHGPGAPIPDKLDVEAFDRQQAEIRDVNEDDGLDITVLHGIEAEITDQGLGISDEWCDQCDLVVAGIHSRPSNPTERVLRAFREYPIDVFAHPSNRLINEREPLELEWDTVMDAASDEDIAIEINAQPERLDLDWQRVQDYRDTVRYVVSTDAHTTRELDLMHLGVAQARRGWCKTADVLNTCPFDELQLIDEV
ncbi:helix-hairpin-helix domain-containing protein [Halosimplex amylolyticum]|uniref:helix-hairpin-helix domain-containing protein n=1 Tax=Halosimplex amylolyticum TaxID=3396616 RepID=UPI003F55FC7D